MALIHILSTTTIETKSANCSKYGGGGGGESGLEIDKDEG